jgi:Restriction Enzyme Adenine Methylase Associated
MPTETPDAAPDAAVAALESGHRPDDTDPTTVAAQIDGEAALREWEGLPPDAVILVPAFAAPMRLPDQAWAMLVLAVDIVGDTDPDRIGEVELFAGSWVPAQPPADLHDGDLVVRLTQPDDPAYPLPRQHAVDVEILLARQGRWQLVGRWCALDERWPWLLAPTAAAVMGLHNDAAEEVARRGATPSLASSPYRWARGGLAELLEAGLIKMGDEVVWNRRNLGVRHTARICINGTLILADGRTYANPSGATTALGGNHQNGWSAFRLVSDGRTLGELRTELWARRGQ